MTRFASRLLDWYARNKRELPWRDHADPYAVWISEIMLQQTRVETAIGYFQHWMAKFPNIAILARASEQDVLREWEGLGYYSRARNLLKAAQILDARYDAQLPPDPAALRALPGIGQYTAGAIGSIAFGLDLPALDGNVRRVLARAFNLVTPIDSRAGEMALLKLAIKHLPEGRAGEFNQALMDLGSQVCVPRNPRCSACPVRGLCRARKLGVQGRRPVRKARKPVPHHVMTAAVIASRGRVALSKRPSKGLLGGMWEFPKWRVAGRPRPALQKAIQKTYRLKVRRVEALAVVHHAYSHFTVAVHPFACQLVSRISKPGREDWHWVRVNELADYPMGKIDRQIARALVKAMAPG